MRTFWSLTVSLVICPFSTEQMFLRVNVASQLSLTEAESAQHQKVQTNVH